MLARVVACCIILVAVLPLSYAISEPVNAQNSVETQNRYLNAELQRSMTAMEARLQENLIENNDINFRALDDRMVILMEDTRMKVIVGGLGAILVAQALVAIVMMRYFKRYSLEGYRDRTSASTVDKEENPIQEFQQPAWQPQQPKQTIGMQFGQNAAGNMSDMNSWQTQPAYAGQWVPPVETQKESNQPWGGKQ